VYPVCYITLILESLSLQDVSVKTAFDRLTTTLWHSWITSASSLIVIKGVQSSYGTWIHAGSGVIGVKPVSWRCF
jgi:hypothetical protein